MECHVSFVVQGMAVGLGPAEVACRTRASVTKTLKEEMVGNKGCSFCGSGGPPTP